MAAKRAQVVSTHSYITGPPYWRPIDEAASKGAHFYQVVNGKTKFFAFTRQQLIYHVKHSLSPVRCGRRPTRTSLKQHM